MAQAARQRVLQGVDILNPQELRYCPVDWLYTHQDLRRKVLKSGQKLCGPIVTSKSEGYSGREVKRLFEGAGLSYSSHSCRRGAAQWAYQYGSDIETIKNVGRWVSLENLSIYISEAKKIALEKKANNNGRYPVLDFWHFHQDTQFDTMSKFK
jgi:hypothetical protein